MSLIVKQEHGDFDFQICPQGNHMATCFSVVDLGMQEINYQGVISHKRKVRISWELPNELITEGELSGQPFSISKNYTLSLHEKSVLYKDLVSWRGRAFTTEELAGFDLTKILGVGCMVNVIHQQSQDGQKTYANVASVTQLPKGVAAPQLVNLIRKFNTDQFEQSEWDILPEWLQNKINLPQPAPSAEEPAAPPSMDSFDDDIPF